MEEENHKGLWLSIALYGAIIGLPVLCIIAGAFKAAGEMFARGEGVGVFIFTFIVIMCCSHEFFHKNWFGYIALAIWMITGMMSVVCTFIFFPLVFACLAYSGCDGE